MPWAFGVYTRGYSSWSNDAANNLPISSSKFDIEDNDFAGGLNNCLTKDGLNVPNGILAWSATGSPVLQIGRGTDGVISSFGRISGSSNPTLQIVGADATGISLNVQNGGISLAVGGVGVLSVLSTKELQINAISGNRAIDITTAAYSFGNVTDNPTFSFLGTGAISFGGALALASVNVTGSSVPANGLYLPSANTLGFASNTTQRATVNASGAWSFVAATSGVTMTVNGLANQAALRVSSASTSGQALGLSVSGGTTSADYALLVADATATNTYLKVIGTGEVFAFEPSTASSIPSGTHQIGYLDVPENSVATGYSLQLSDRGKAVVQTSVNNITIPANASVAFPIGTTILIMNNSGSSIGVNITTDTLTFWPSGSTGARTLADKSVMTLYKLGTASWRCWGFGIT